MQSTFYAHILRFAEANYLLGLSEKIDKVHVAVYQQLSPVQALDSNQEL